MVRGDPHGYNSFENYLLIHEQRIAEFEHFIVDNGIEYEVADDQVFFVGRLRCRCDTFLDVDKTLHRLPNGRVRTIKYSYHAGILLPEPLPLFRYDNAHAHPGHADDHHKHRYDRVTGAELKPPIWVGVDAWPHLSDCIAELEQWCIYHEQ